MQLHHSVKHNYQRRLLMALNDSRPPDIIPTRYYDDVGEALSAQ